MNINSEIKDKVLNFICEAKMEQHSYVQLKETLNILELEFDDLNAILNQFERFGFISNLNLRRNSTPFSLIVHLEALDFKNKGGFLITEQTVELALEKLALEVENLSKSFPEKANTFASIGSNIVTCLNFFALSR